MGRPRTVNARIQDLPRGFRKVGGKWYWRPTDAGTRLVADELKKLGVNTSCIRTPIEAKQWWQKHVSARLDRLAPDDEVAGTIEELVRLYEEEDLPTFKRAETRAEYEGRIRRIRAAFGKRRYPRTQQEALEPGVLRDPDIQKHLHANRSRAASANKDVQLLSRIFRIAKTRWGKTAYNPCADIEYLPEHARDVYVDDDTFGKVNQAAPPIFQVMTAISSQTAARIGSVYTIVMDQVREDGLIIRTGKKRNGKGYIETLYAWTPDLRAEVDKALAIRAERVRKGVQHGQALFLTEDGTPYTKEAYKSAWRRVRLKLGLGAREITVHDLGRAKAVSDAPSDEAGKQLARHDDHRVTKRVYRRKLETVTPLPAVGSR